MHIKERLGYLRAANSPASAPVVVMSLAQSAKMHGHDPWAYLKDVLTRLPSHLNSRIAGSLWAEALANLQHIPGSMVKVP